MSTGMAEGAEHIKASIGIPRALDAGPSTSPHHPRPFASLKMFSLLSPQPDVEEVQRLPLTIGSMLIGTFMAAILYGLTCFLTYRYFRNYHNDRIGFKILVAILFIIDTLHSVLSFHLCYHYLVEHYFNPEILKSSVWSLQATLFVGAFAPLVSNGFYLTRLYKIGQRNVFLIGGLSLLILARLGFEFAAAILSFLNPEFKDLSRYIWVVKVFCTISSVADLSLAGLICYHLHRRRTGHQRTDSAIDLVIAYTFTTGVLTGVVCFISLLAVFLIRGLVDLAVHAILCKLYVNSVLSVLNSRKSHRKTGKSIYEKAAFGVDTDETGMTTTRFSNRTTQFSMGGITTFTETTSDATLPSAPLMRKTCSDSITNVESPTLPRIPLTEEIAFTP
ncbi:hypothetical protein CC2G_014444 [Coprinopsis cinerea AmutBmut pab1-1]|nr:hypothetical protein CC2G_014444 [Coprinopsis cinerea AmutBmut pab1-1]